MDKQPLLTPVSGARMSWDALAAEEAASEGAPPEPAGSAKVVAAVPTGCPAETEEAAALAICHRLRDGAARMTRQQFRNCLKRSIGAGKDYADNCRRHFQDNPAAYLASRTPQTQSTELLRVILKITRQDNEKAQPLRAIGAEDSTKGKS